MMLLLPRKIAFATLFLSFLFPAYSQAQVSVSTFVGPNSGINDGLVMDADGNLYGSFFASLTAGGGQLYKVDTAGLVSLFSSGFYACNGLAINLSGDLFAVDYTQDPDSHQVYKIDANGNRTAFGPAIFGASGIISDPLSDTLYVSQYNSGPMGDGIVQLAPDGSVSDFSNHPSLNGPVGLAFDDDQQLYAANFGNGKIFRITHRGDSLTELADIPGGGFSSVGFLTYAAGYLYATGIASHKIYQISLTGDLVEFAGTGTSESIDGEADTARFSQPNGITTNADQTKLYISDAGTQSIRVISGFNDSIPDTTTHVLKLADREKATLSCYPNPASDRLHLVCSLPASGQVWFDIIAVDGSILRSINQTINGAEEQQIEVDSSGLPSGYYTVSMRSDFGKTTQKLLIVK